MMFEEQFAVNKVKTPWIGDFFDVKQRDGEPLKDYLNRFYEVHVCVQHPNEKMVVDRFVKGLYANSFSNYFLRNRSDSMMEI